MHPAPSLIVFTTLSGLGFGLLFFLGLGLRAPLGWLAFLWFGLGYGLVCAGLAASAFHLGRPERALRAFSQWRTSWLSREAVLAAVTLLALAPHAFGSVFLGAGVPWSGLAGAVLAPVTVLATAMIYAQLRSVPRWHHWSTPLVFLAASLAGGALLAGLCWPAMAGLVALGAALLAQWWLAPRRAATLASATGLGVRGTVRPFEAPHTGGNYLLREMVYRVGRRRAASLRRVAFTGAVLGPLVSLLLLPGVAGLVLAAALHVPGMLAARWLFFAEAEHVVGLYYHGDRG